MVDTGYENVWFEGNRLNGCREGQISWVHGEYVVQGISVFVGTSHTAVVSLQNSSQQERNLISCSSAIHRPH